MNGEKSKFKALNRGTWTNKNAFMKNWMMGEGGKREGEVSTEKELELKT